MNEHDQDDERAFEAFMKGEHAVSREYQQGVDDRVPEAVDALILRQAAEQAARQQRLQDQPSPRPWYRQAWFAPASGVAIAVMVTVVMFDPLKAPLQQAPEIKALTEAVSAKSEMNALSEERAAIADAGRMQHSSAELARPKSASSAKRALADRDRREDAPTDAFASAVLPASTEADQPVLAERSLAKVKRSERQVAASAMPASTQAAAQSEQNLEEEGAARVMEAPKRNALPWPFTEALAAQHWEAALAYLDALKPAADDTIVPVIARMREQLLQQQLPVTADTDALQTWVQQHARLSGEPYE